MELFSYHKYGKKGCAEINHDIPPNDRFKGTNAFITLPVAPSYTKNDIEVHVRDVMKAAEYIICEETHQKKGKNQGIKHFHAIALAEPGKNFNIHLRKFKIKNQRTGEEQHANIQWIRSLANCYQYMFKEDEHPLETANIKELCNSKGKTRASKLTVGDVGKFKDAQELFESEVGSQLSLQSAKKVFEGFTTVIATTKKFEEFKEAKWKFQGKGFKFNYEEKCRHFFVWGGANRGKTIFANELVRDYGAIRLTISGGIGNWFVGGWFPQARLCVIDDKDKLNWTYIKTLVNAEENENVSIKHGYQIGGARKIFFIFSNMDPMVTFGLCEDEIDQFRVRFNVIKVEKEYIIDKPKESLVFDLVDTE